jgi:hypothetical protein
VDDVAGGLEELAHGERVVAKESELVVRAVDSVGQPVGG